MVNGCDQMAFDIVSAVSMADEITEDVHVFFRGGWFTFLILHGNFSISLIKNGSILGI